ncbi:hypothetical protein EON65_56765 [archaeon]|nr:MAG: hypothetical protein EON65_56765 [archaeon]
MLPDQEVRLHVTKVQIKLEGQHAFEEWKTFRIFAAQLVDQNFRIDLDPFESRQYVIWLDIIQNFEYVITLTDVKGFICSIVGARNGVSASLMPKPHETPLSQMNEGQRVRISPNSSMISDVNLQGTFIICLEDGHRNDFGIFAEGSRLLPYLDMERGSAALTGKYSEILSWDRDTVAYPPDDLMAVHVRHVESNIHSWVRRSDLLAQ